MLCPPPPRAKEAELPTAKGEGGGPGVSPVGGVVGVVSGGGVVGCPCGLGLARRRQLALISMFAYINISAAKRPPVAYEVPLCAVPYV